MKKLTATLLAVVALAVTGYSQLSTTPPPPPTNVPTITDGLNTIVEAIKAGNTNWYFAAYGLYAPKLDQKYGGGIGAFYPLSKYIVTGLRMDYVDGGFWMPSGNATLQLPIKIFPWLTITPFGYAGIGIPISGATWGDITIPGNYHNNNGEPTAILGYGAAVHLWGSKDNKYNIELVGDQESWSGFPGQQIRVGALFRVKF
jgi:hypothetical protein